MKTLLFTVSSFTLTCLSCCLSLLSAFLYSKPFWNIEINCEINDCHFNIFFLSKYNRKKKTWKVFLRCHSLAPKPVYQTLKQSEYVTGWKTQQNIYIQCIWWKQRNYDLITDQLKKVN